MKKNITIIGLTKNFKRDLAKALADELDMIFADINALMEYELINSNMLEKVGQEYYDKKEHNVIEKIASYENTIMTIDFASLNKGNNFETVKAQSLVIYLKLDYEDFKKLNREENENSKIKINETLFKDRNKLMENMADIKVKVDEVDINHMVKKIFKEIAIYFKEN